MGSAWVDSEAVCGSVGGLHLLLPAAIQTSGLHHRLVGCSQWGIISHFNHINSHLLNLIPLKLIGWLPLNTWNEIISLFNVYFLVHNSLCRVSAISIFFLLRHICWHKVLHHRLYFQEVPQAEAALWHPIHHLDQFTHRPAAKGA